MSVFSFDKKVSTILLAITEATNLYEDDCVFTEEMLSISITEKLIFEIKNGMIEYKLSLS